MIRRRPFLIMMIGVVCFFLLSCSERIPEGNTDKWIHYGTSEGDQYYYDKDSVTYIKPKLIRVWTKIKLSEVYKDQLIQMRKESKESIHGWDKLEYNITHEEVDCTNNTIKTTTMVLYNDEGKILHGWDIPDAKIIQIEPGSISDSLHRTICRK